MEKSIENIKAKWGYNEHEALYRPVLDTKFTFGIERMTGSRAQIGFVVIMRDQNIGSTW